ncbi:MAG: AAA family ATPase [Gammaproteobacteria bacterium]
MDPVKNPYSPGAGTLPPELTGRDDIRETVRVALLRALHLRSEKSIMFIGLRGVGKTVLLLDMQKQAKREGLRTVYAEAPETRSLPSVLVPPLKSVLLKMSDSAKIRYALSALAGFVRAFKLEVGGITLEALPRPGLADAGDLEHDLPVLMETIGEAAKEEETAVAILIDELQYVDEKGLSALCASLHRISQQGLPVLIAGAGLPQLRGKLGKAKSYAERMFNFFEAGALPEQAAKDAILNPALAENITISEAALCDIVNRAHGYPYFLQEWGRHVWNAAKHSPIVAEDVRFAEKKAVAALDADFFMVRFDRLTPSEKNYLRAMAEAGDDNIRSANVAEILRKPPTALGPHRAQLINKGMIYSPAHGDIAFTVPLFADFLKRTMPAVS